MTKGPEKKNEQPKKRAEDSKKRVEELRKKQAETKKQPAEKDVPSSTPAEKSDQAASTEGKTRTKTQRRRESRQKEKARREQKQEGAEGEKKEGATEAMEVDEEQAPTSTGPDDGGEEPNHSAAVSTLAIRERSSEAEAGIVEPMVASQPQPQLPQQASEPAGNSLPGVGGGTGAASGPSEPCQPGE